MRLSRAQFEALFEGVGLAAGGGAKGAGTDCGRMTQRVEFGIVLLGFLFRIW